AMRHGRTPVRSLIRGLLLAAPLVVPPTLVPAQEVRLPDNRLGTRVAPLLLLSRSDVQIDLKMTPEQVGAARHVIIELHEKDRTLKDKPDAQVITGRRAIDEASHEWINGNLSAEQKARLSQLDLQWEGPAALVSRKAIADALKLTDAQFKTLSE